MKPRYFWATAGVVAVGALMPVWGQRTPDRDQTPEGMARSIVLDVQEARRLAESLTSEPPGRDRESGGRTPTSTRRRLEIVLARAERTARELESIETQISRLRNSGGMSGGIGISDNDFVDVLKAYRSRPFPGERLDFLKTVAGKSFSVRQLDRLLELETFSADKQKVIYLLYPRLVDTERFFTLEKHFTFASEWKEVCTHLGILKP